MSKNSVLILKQLTPDYSVNGKILSGIARVENSFGVTDFCLSLVNVSTLYDGKFFIYIFGDKSPLSFALSARPTSFRIPLECPNDFEKGFACALVAVKDFIPVTVAFGKTQDFSLTLLDAKKLIDKSCLKAHQNALSSPSPLVLEQPASKDVYSDAPYDDEAVATENYFELEQDIKQKLEKVKVFDNEITRNEDEFFNGRNKKEEEKITFGANLFQDEKDSVFIKDDKLPFFATAKAELDLLFSRFPPFTLLNDFFPDSKWVKIYYDTERYYVVGVIKEEGLEKYVCYGVPATYSKEPPKELKGYCSFIPLSIFDMQGEGFWMMFQDAVTGDCLFPEYF